jgi:hypothetical protein
MSKRDGLLCPRCGTPRLIRRHDRLERARLGQVPLGVYLRWRLGARDAARRRGAIVRHRYHCELCGHDWEICEIERESEGGNGEAM